MSLGNVLHKLFPTIKIIWLNWLFQLPVKVAPLKRLGTSADKNARPVDEVIFDLADDTPLISIRKQKRYLDYIVLSGRTVTSGGSASLLCPYH